MDLHANAKLGLAGRFALVKAIEEGLSLKAAAVAFSVFTVRRPEVDVLRKVRAAVSAGSRSLTSLVP